MPAVKAKELRELSDAEMKERLAKLRKENFELLQKKEIGQLDRPHRFRQIRREISQLMTVASQKAKAARGGNAS